MQGNRLPEEETQFRAYRRVVKAFKEGHAVLRPEVASVIRAAYDPVLPDVAQEASHALRLEARLPRPA